MKLSAGTDPLDNWRCLRVERRGGVLEVTIDNPRSELNAVDAALHEELASLFGALRRETDARAILLTGSKRAFCAGGDFGWLAELQGMQALDAVRRDGKSIVWDLLDVEIPIVAALNGPAVGLGASIALLCDVIFMADTASIADPHVRVGIVAGDGGTAIWPLVLGPARAKQFLLTGDPLDAATAERFGLVNRVVPGDRLLAEARAFADRLAAGAPLALRYTKLAINKWIKAAANVSFDVATALEIATFQSEDHAEALAAIRDKRKPAFKGR
jgi:enoyl-CoA hydratase